MANEIAISTRLSWSRGGAQIIASVTGREDQIGTQGIENVQTIGGSSEPIDLGDVTDPGHLFFKNENSAWADLTTEEKAGYTDKADYDEKNSVYLGNTNPATDSNATITLKPQQGTALIRPPAAWYGIKDTDDVSLLVVAIQV